MKRHFLILLVVLLIIFRPNLTRAETHVYVSFSVGGAVVIGAGVIYWSVSYNSRISERKPSEENPDRLSLTMDSSEIHTPHVIPFLPQPIQAHEPTRVDGASIPNDRRATPAVALPLFVFRW